MTLLPPVLTAKPVMVAPVARPPVSSAKPVEDAHLLSCHLSESDSASLVLSLSETSRYCLRRNQKSAADREKFLRCEAELSATLRDVNLALYDVPADGNCLFYALSHQFYGRIDFHGFIRQTVADHLEAHTNFFSDFNVPDVSFTTFVRELRKDGTYGDHFSLVAFSKEFKVPVKVYQPNGFHTEVDYPESVYPTVQVAYNSYNHYYSVAALGGVLSESVVEKEVDAVESKNVAVPKKKVKRYGMTDKAFELEYPN